MNDVTNKASTINNKLFKKVNIGDELIKFKDIHFMYKPNKLLKKMNKVNKLKPFEVKINNLTINSGEYIYVIGENGAGKSTFIKLLNRELNSNTGELFYKGIDITKSKGKVISQLRQDIGYVFQDFALIEDMTVKENLIYPLDVVGGFSKEEKNKKVNEISKKIGITNKLNYLPNELSGGEKQKVSIARSLMLDPDVIIADEPTGNLDPNFSEDINQTFNALNKEGKTIIMITHNKEFVNDSHHRVIKFEKGSIVSDIKGGNYL